MSILHVARRNYSIFIFGVQSICGRVLSNEHEILVADSKAKQEHLQ